MGWLDSPLSVHNGNVNAFFDGREITLDLVAELSRQYLIAKQDKERKFSSENKSAKSKRTYISACEDFNLKESYILKAIELFNTKKCSGNCGMNYCDDNGCMERTRILVEPILDF